MGLGSSSSGFGSHAELLAACKALGGGGTEWLGVATCCGCKALGGGGTEWLGVATCCGCKALGGGGTAWLGVAVARLWAEVAQQG